MEKRVVFFYCVMMTPRVASEDCGEKLRIAILRVRLLLALHGRVSGDDNPGQESAMHAGSVTPSPPRQRTVWAHSDSLHSVDLEEGSSDRCQLDARRTREQAHEDHSQEVKEEEKGTSITAQALPLPPLRWQLPTLRQRQEAVEKRRERRQKRTDRGQKRGWFATNPVAAAAVAVCGDIDDANDDHQDEENDRHARTSSSSAFTLTGDRSDRSSSKDTYAASHASTDDVYIHELARGHESTLNASSNFHRRWGSASLGQGGTNANSLATHLRHHSALLAVAGVHSESTAVTAQLEFDRIGAGEEAPYASYLFSPEARIVDLSMLPLAAERKHEGGEKKATADGSRSGNDSWPLPAPRNTELVASAPEKDGCTRVCFSPEGDCYIVGTECGKLWFVQVSVKAGHIVSTTAASPLPLHGHSGAVTDIAFDDVGTCFASSGADACVILWNQRTPSKVRRINTDGGVPVAVRFMPKNNNYLLVSLPRHHLLRLYNSSTGFPVTRKGQLIRVEATALVMEPCTYPFLFLGDAHGAITVWRYRVSRVDDIACPSVVKDVNEAIKRSQPTTLPQSLLPQVPHLSTPSSLHSAATAAGQFAVESHLEHEKRGEFMPSTITEGQSQFEKVAGCVVEKGTPVASLVASSMNHQQFHCLLRAQRMGQEAHERSTVKKWAAAALGGGWKRNEGNMVSNKKDGKISTRSAYAVMLLASFPRDRLVVLSVQPSKSTPHEYKLVPMLVIMGACRIRQMSVGTSFCVDNTRCPTISCTCEEGFVQIIACTPARLPAQKDENVKKSCLTGQKPVQWSVMATLPVPCGGIPRSLAWSPDMGLLVAVTEEGILYEWRRVRLHLGVPHPGYYRSGGGGGEEHCRDDDDSTGGPRALHEADEWRICLQREKERQMRRYRAQRGTADSDDGSLSGLDDLWARSGDSMSRSPEQSSR
ncbi:hypothetical protein C3747_22g92 [Trypanosoma cruzi]|nr:hypothetical protein C3747_22g92 [Trypanosoma cruzi]